MNPAVLRLHKRLSFLSRDAVTTRESWGLAQMAGRIVEISGSGATAALTAATGLLLEAQRSGEPSAWITVPGSTFYPPDIDESGVDLDGLAVVRAPDAQGAARAAEQLIRSGGFGLVVIDLGPRFIRPRPGEGRPRYGHPYGCIATPLQTRLVGLAQKHDCAVVVLTEKPAYQPSMGSLISLRAEARRRSTQRAGDFVQRSPPAPYEVEVYVLKDKRRGPGHSHRKVFRGPPGLR
ncbi:MAG: recombinase A [Acidobacteriota bacterium]